MPEISLIQDLENTFNQLAELLWGWPIVILLVGGGFGLTVYSRLMPFRHLGHALGVLLGRHDDDRARGDISHFQALSTALSGTLGMGNIAGVAAAIGLGGPGAIFWMWVTAVIGMTTKFFTATLAVMFRGRDSAGHWQGGPMYVIREGLGKKWQPLAFFFALAAMLGTTPIFQVNQVVQILRDEVVAPGLTNLMAAPPESDTLDLIIGATLSLVVLYIIIGQARRVGRVTGVLVPAMVAAYLAMTLWVLWQFADAIPAAFALIFGDAFSGTAAAGGALGSVIIMGVRRGAFSNEAGIGTESMAHGAARTEEPVREGLVAMLGPAIDTLIVCTCTALVILTTGVWQSSDESGALLTLAAFDHAMPGAAGVPFALMVAALGLSTVISFGYYGTKCLGYLIGAQRQHWYWYFYALSVVAGAVMSFEMVVGFVDSLYALMAIPTMTSTLLLAPRVRREAQRYFAVWANRERRR
ncbi:MAG: alanine/glycine:cation symporter family protein [Pseudomonadota bacterium]